MYNQINVDNWCNTTNVFKEMVWQSILSLIHIKPLLNPNRLKDIQN